ncbi:MAG: aldo/keto reductase [Chloroflexota bacterium]
MFPQLTYLPLGKTGLMVSQAGFGSYRVDIPNAVHRSALTHALRSGINLIDTSSNYADGGSEQLIGSVIHDLIEQEQLNRSAIVIVSKGGYLQGQNFAISQQRKTWGNPFPDLVEYGPQLEHCIHPVFLEDQINRSLERLTMDHLDVYLLHNPEYYLGYAKKVDKPLGEARDEYYRRIKLAFTHLEQEVEKGRIGSYGISSNSFPKSADSYDFTSLEQVWSIANEISPDHHFRVIQLPMNLAETGGDTEKNQSESRSVLELAREHQIGVLINRPLNAVIGNNLIRLADLPDRHSLMPPDHDEVEGLIDGLINQEALLQRAVFAIDIPFRTKQEFAATTAAGRMLSQRWQGFGTYSNWRDVVSGYLQPRARFAISFLRSRPELPPEAETWIREYEALHERTLEAILSVYRSQEADMLETIKLNVDSISNDWKGAATLSQAAIRTLRTTAGITCVLVGMRKPAYVSDVLNELEVKVPQKNRAEAWSLLQEAIQLE